MDDVDKSGEISLVYAGGIRNGGDVAKALALGADAVAIGTAALIALNCNKDIPEADYEGTIGVEAGYCYHCHTGRCPVGVATQDPELAETARSGRRRRARLQLPAHAHDGMPDDGPRLRQDQCAFAGARRPGRTDHGGFRDGHGAAGRHAVHGRAAGNEALLRVGADPSRLPRTEALLSSRRAASLKWIAKTGRSGDPTFSNRMERQWEMSRTLITSLKTDGLDRAREKEIGQHIGYRYDVNLLPDYSRLTPFLKKYIEVMGWQDLNWLEDVHLGYEEGRPAVFDRNINGWVTVPEGMQAARQSAGPRHAGPRAAGEVPDVQASSPAPAQRGLQEVLASC